MVADVIVELGEAHPRQSGKTILTVYRRNAVLIDYVAAVVVNGLSENAAIAQLENNRLSYGGSEYAASDLAAGTVIGQSRDAFSDVEEHSKITLRVSTGPVLG